MSERFCRWGILGSAGIARKNWKGIWNAGNCRLTAVASRRLDRAQEYVAQCQTGAPFEPSPAACGSYEELLARDDVDAVYIPLPTGTRKEWVLKAAQAGKHVLAEKPVGVAARDVEEMIAACREHDVQFMDGVMFMHSRRLDALRAVINDGQSIGRLRRIASHFSFVADDEFLKGNIRAHGQLEPLGALGDLGWYNIRLSLWLMNGAMPKSVVGRTLTGHGKGDVPADVPLEFIADLFFDDHVTSSFYCSFLADNQQWAQISGTKGSIAMEDFVVPFHGSEVDFDVMNTQLVIRGCDFHMEEHTRRVALHEYSSGSESAQETNMFRHFAQLVLDGTRDASWGEWSLKTQRVLEACLESAKHDGALVTL